MKNTKLLLVAALAGATSLAAFANDNEGTPVPTPFASTVSAAQVRAELDAYKANGVNTYAMRYNPVAGFASQRTRADVRAEYLASRDQVAAVTGEDSGSSWLARRAVRQAPTRLAGEPANAAR